jgi:hypothetical protein
VPRAEVVLPDGTRIAIEGSEAEVSRLLSNYRERASPPEREGSRRASVTDATAEQDSSITLPEIVRHVKECPESEAIEKHILDRTARVERVLLPLYVIHEHMANAVGLTSGEIARITQELGVPVSQSNVSTIIGGAASQYVVSDQLAKRGVARRLKISRKGLQYMKEVLDGDES